MKLFYLLLSTVVLTTNPLFAMDRLEDEQEHKAQRRYPDCLKIKGRDMQLLWDTSKVGTIELGEGFVNTTVGGLDTDFSSSGTKIVKLELDAWAMSLLQAPQQGRETTLWRLADPLPEFSMITSKNIRLDADDVIKLKRHEDGRSGAISYHFKLKKCRFEITIRPLEFVHLKNR